VVYSFCLAVWLLLCASATAAEKNSASPTALLHDAALREISAGNFSSGCAKAAEVTRRDPGAYAAYNLQGVCAVNQGDFPAAEAHFRKSLSLNPHYQEAYINLALCLLRQRKAAESRVVLETALGLAPRDWRVLVRAAAAAFSGGLGDLGGQALQMAVRSDPAAIDEVLRLAKQDASRKNYQAARALLLGIQSSAEADDRWHGLLGYTAYKLRDPAAAARYLRRAIELAPEKEEHYLNMGEMLLYYNSEEAAISFFKSGLERLPQSPLLHYGLAVSYWSHERNPEDAIQELEAALGSNSRFAPALALLCRIHYRQKHWERLEESAQRLMRIDPSSPLGYYYTAVSQLNLPPGGNTAARAVKVQALLQTAMRLDPAFPDTRLALGKLFEQEGRLHPAIRQIREAVRLDPNNSEGLYLLARLYRETGQPEKSAAALERFKQLRTGRKTDYEALFRVVH